MLLEALSESSKKPHPLLNIDAYFQGRSACLQRAQLTSGIAVHWGAQRRAAFAAVLRYPTASGVARTRVPIFDPDSDSDWASLGDGSAESQSDSGAELQLEERIRADMSCVSDTALVIIPAPN